MSVPAYRDIPGFARVVEVAELAANDYNLDIRRYVNLRMPSAALTLTTA